MSIKTMITVGDLRRALEEYPLDAVCEVWEGDPDLLIIYPDREMYGKQLGQIVIEEEDYTDFADVDQPKKGGK
jgi:hypothetical protein